MSTRVYRIECSDYDEETRRYWTQVAEAPSFILGGETDRIVDFSTLNDSGSGEFSVEVEEVEGFLEYGYDITLEVADALRADVKAARDSGSDTIDYKCV